MWILLFWFHLTLLIFSTCDLKSTSHKNDIVKIIRVKKYLLAFLHKSLCTLYMWCTCMEEKKQKLETH